MRRPLVVLTLVLGALAAVYGALVLLDLLARHEVRTTRTLALTAQGGVALEAGSGDVTVAAGGGVPRLEAVADHGLFGGAEITLSDARGDGRLSVRARCRFPSSLLSCGASLRLVVPPGAAVAVSTGSGDLALRGLRGDVVARTGSGDVELTGAGGSTLSADTGSGNITAAGLTARRLRAKTGSGDVEVTATSAPDDVRVDTGSGDVALTVPDVAYAVSTDTGSGDAHVSVRRDDASPRRLQVKTGSGDLTVRPAR